MCSAPLASLQLPDRALKNEILYGLDREAAQATLEPLVAARDAELAAHLKALRTVPAVAGVRERFASTQRPCITGEASAATIRELAEAPEVYQVFVGDEADPDGQGEATGDVVRAATQTQMYHREDNTGDIAPTRSPANGFSRLTVGVIDRGLQDFHRAFRDTSSQTTGDRIVGRFQCQNGGTCVASTDLPYDPVITAIFMTVDWRG